MWRKEWSRSSRTRETTLRFFSSTFKTWRIILTSFLLSSSFSPSSAFQTLTSWINEVEDDYRNLEQVGIIHPLARSFAKDGSELGRVASVRQRGQHVVLWKRELEGRSGRRKEKCHRSDSRGRWKIERANWIKLYSHFAQNWDTQLVFLPLFECICTCM